MHLKLTIQYDGTDFAGSQLQPNGRTVQGELEAALARVAGSPSGERPIRVSLAGRTDAGVHAYGQVASLDFPDRPRLGTPDALGRSLNGVLPPDVAVISAEIAPKGFHARFSAKRRAYRYLLWVGHMPQPLLRRYALHVRRPLDIEVMAQAASALVGTHDLAAFAGSGMGVPSGEDGEAPSTVRTVYLARLHRLPSTTNFWLWEAPDGAARTRADETNSLYALDLVANAFLPQMIRNIVGTLLEVGTRTRTAETILELIDGRDRRRAGPTAKPHGLCLLWVDY